MWLRFIEKHPDVDEIEDCEVELEVGIAWKPASSASRLRRRLMAAAQALLKLRQGCVQLSGGLKWSRNGMAFWTSGDCMLVCRVLHPAPQVSLQYTAPMPPSTAMRWVIYLFGSGMVFFAGIGLVLLSLVLFAVAQRRWPRAMVSLSAFIGLILIALSAVPLPNWLYGLAGGVSILWLLAERSSQRPAMQKRRPWLRGLVAVVWVAAVVSELPYQRLPTVPTAERSTLYILGDSVAAGMSRGEETWPKLLSRFKAITVADFSQPGATARSALRQAEGVLSEGGVVLLEIGGNDLLGSTAAADFEQHLELVLGRVCAPGRLVLMFELPLPPFRNDFGRIQRRLAAEHGILLIPRRVFVTVLTTDGATVDSIHLSPRGHERMADVVWNLLGPAFNR
jgi:acyl-CoA thioesterase-1